jgi:hypothetical protein
MEEPTCSFKPPGVCSSMRSSNRRGLTSQSRSASCTMLRYDLPTKYDASSGDTPLSTALEFIFWKFFA